MIISKKGAEKDKMWLPKCYWEALMRIMDDLDRRVRRLEIMLLKDAKNTIASLDDKKTGIEQKNNL